MSLIMHRNSTPQVVGRKCDDRMHIKVNKRTSYQKRSDEATTDILEDFSNISYQLPQESTKDKLKKLTQKRPTATPVTHSHSQSINQTRIQASPPKKKKSKKTKKSRSKSKNKVAKKDAAPNQSVLQLIGQNLKRKKTETQKTKSFQQLIERERDLKRQELELKNQEIRMMNASRFQRKREKSVGQLPWGLNQERLKTYLLQQAILHNNNLIQQQIRSHKQVPDPKQRREELGVSFLNNYDENTVQHIKQRTKNQSFIEQDTSHIQHQISLDPEKQEEVRQYLEFKRKLIEMQEEEAKRQQALRALKIKENLQNLNVFVKGNNKAQAYMDRSRAASEYNQQQQQKPAKKKSKSKKQRKLLMQFRTSSERYKQIQEEYNNQDPNEKSLLGLISHSSSNIGSQDGDVSERIEELDTSFFSDRQYLATNQDIPVPTLGMDKQRPMLQNDSESYFNAMTPEQQEFNEEEQRQMAEIRSIEQASRVMKSTSSSLLNHAATIIQKNWRGYVTRQIIAYAIEQQTLQREDGIRREPSQDAQGTKMIFDQEAYNNYIEDSFEEESIHQFKSSRTSQDKSINKPSQQSSKKSPHLVSQSSSRKPVQNENRNDTNRIDLARQLEEQKEKWNEMLSYVSQLQKKGSRVDINEVLGNIKKISELNLDEKKPFKKKRELSIDVEKIEEEYRGHQHQTIEEPHSSSQQSIPINSPSERIDLSEMRKALGSESMLKDQSKSSDQPLNDSSIFEQNPFKDFTSRKFRELLKRENMDQLIALREKALEERRRSQGKMIKDALKNNRISPKTFDKEWLRLEKWVTKEKRELQERKMEMERGWKGTYDTVLKTQRDLMFMQKNHQEQPVFTILANSFSHEHIQNNYGNRDQEIHIKIIDNYHTDSNQMSQSYVASESIGYTPVKDVVDIAAQNHQLQMKYHEYERSLHDNDSELCRSEQFEQDIPTQPMNLNVPNTSPTPSPKNYEDNSPQDTKDWETDMLSEPMFQREEDVMRLGQSQMVKVSQLVEENMRNTHGHQFQPLPPNPIQHFETLETDEDPQDKYISSYAIIISNQLIAEELVAVYQEMLTHNIDLIDQFNKQSYIVQNKREKQQQQQQQSNKKKGIKTNLQQVKQYLLKLSEHIQSEYLEELVRQLNIPLGPSSKEMLKYLHFNEFNSSCSQFDSSTDSTYQHSAILNTELFAEMEKNLMEQSFIKQPHEFLLELEHIHNKVVFDAMNEALDQFRPYGLKGQPFPWHVDSSKLVPRKTTSREVRLVVQKAEEKVVEWAQCLVGIIIDKEDSPFPRMLMFDQEYLNQIKEDRLLKMLNCEILEQEERWINYDEEQTEIQVELSDIVFDQLICEFIYENLL